jgi:hypothetical protein
MKKPLIIVLCFVLLTTIDTGKLIAQDSLRNFMTKYASAAGNEFWFSFPPCYEEVAGAENTTRVFVVSHVRQPVTVEVPGKGWASTKMAPGYSDYDSYGFPASVALGDLTKMDTMPPIPAYKVLCDGSAQGIDGKLPIVNEIPHDANIRSNLAIIYMDIDPDSSYNYEFKVVDEKGKPTKIIPGITTKIYWTLKVVNPAKDAQARIVFVDKAGNDTSILVTYEAFPVSFNSQNIDFGYTSVNTPYARPFKVMNTSDTSMKISRLECKSNTEGFVLTEKNGLPITLPFTLTSKQEKEYIVVFNKGTIGKFVDSIGIGNECQFFYSIELSCKTIETDT